VTNIRLKSLSTSTAPAPNSAELSKANAENTKLRTEMASMAATAADAKTRLSEKDALITKLTHEAKSATSKLLKITEGKLIDGNRLINLTIEHRALQGEKQTVVKERDNLTGEVSILELSLKEHMERAAEINMKNSLLSEKVEELTAQLEAKRSDSKSKDAVSYNSKKAFLQVFPNNLPEIFNNLHEFFNNLQAFSSTLHGFSNNLQAFSNNLQAFSSTLHGFFNNLQAFSNNLQAFSSTLHGFSNNLQAFSNNLHEFSNNL